MARIPQPRKCNRCGNPGPFYWKKIDNSVWLYTPEGDRHYCNGRAVGKQLDSPAKPASPSPSPVNQDEQGLNETPKANDWRKFYNLPPVKPEVEPKVEPKVETPADKVDLTELLQLMREYVDSRFSTFRESLINELKPKVVEHQIRLILPDGAEKIIAGQHPKFGRLLLQASRKHNCMLVGPAGSGKTYAAEKVAETLGKPYYAVSVGPQTSKSDLLGYMDAHGKLVRTVLREAYENGGVFLLDEIDAGNPGVLTVLNALLANGHVGFPDGMVRKHPDFICIAGANTFGLGANRLYVGRNQLDAATLDRFIVLEWNYNESLERSVAKGNEQYLNRVWQLRQACDRLQIRAVFGTRKIIHGCTMLNAGDTMQDVENEVLWAGVSVDDKAKLVNATR